MRRTSSTLQARTSTKPSLAVRRNRSASLVHQHSAHQSGVHQGGTSSSSLSSSTAGGLPSWWKNRRNTDTTKLPVAHAPAVEVASSATTGNKAAATERLHAAERELQELFENEGGAPKASVVAKLRSEINTLRQHAGPHYYTEEGPRPDTSPHGPITLLPYNDDDDTKIKTSPPAASVVSPLSSSSVLSAITLSGDNEMVGATYTKSAGWKTFVRSSFDQNKKKQSAAAAAEPSSSPRNGCVTLLPYHCHNGTGGSSSAAAAASTNVVINEEAQTTAATNHDDEVVEVEVFPPPTKNEEEHNSNCSNSSNSNNNNRQFLGELGKIITNLVPSTDHDDEFTPPATHTRESFARVRAEASAALQVSRADLRVANAKLAAYNKELNAERRKAERLKASLSSCRSDVTELRAQLAETRLFNQEKDKQLEDAYQALSEGATERGMLRSEIKTLETQLTDSEKELSEWANELIVLKDAVDDENDRILSHHLDSVA